MQRAFAAPCLLLAVAACGGRGPLDGASDAGAASTPTTPTPLPTSAAQPPATCTLDPGFPAGTAVVTCGLPPHVTLVGADEAALVVLTEGGTFYRVDKATGDRLALYTAPTSPETGPTTFALGMGDDATLAGGALLAFTLGPGVWSLDPSRPSTPVQVLGAVFENHPLVDQTSMYFLRADFGPGYIQYVDVERAPIGGGATTVLDPTYDSPVALAGGYLYVATEVDGPTIDPPYPRLLRVPITGGTPSPVLDALDTSGVAGSITADADAVYVIGSSPTTGVQASRPITRFPVDGGAPTTLAVAGPFDPEVPGPVPWGLRLDETFLYYMGTPGQSLAFGAFSTLYRVPNDAPSSTPQSVASAKSIGPPVFDADFVYIALERGGVEGPIEGAVLRVPKSALSRPRR